MTIADTAHLPRRVRRRVAVTPVWRRWTVAWLGGVVVGIVNGTTRELVYREHGSDLTAHQISTAVALALFSLYFAILESRWPIPTTRTALQIGGTWLLLTVLFEFGFGHFVDGKSPSEPPVGCGISSCSGSASAH